MDDRTRNLKGSPSRDNFKWKHKFGPSKLYACDADFILVSKTPPGIVAVLDHKLNLNSGAVTFSEVLAYNEFLRLGIDVYLVVTNDEITTYDIHQYLGGNFKPNPPTFDSAVIESNLDDSAFWAWEKELRNRYTESGQYEVIKLGELRRAEIARHLQRLADWVEGK